MTHPRPCCVPRRRASGGTSAAQLFVTVAVALAASASAHALGASFSGAIADGARGTHAQLPASAVAAEAAGAQALARAVEAAADAPHRLHVFVSNDWDVPQHTRESFRLQEQLHERHPALKVTQFVGPYTFTDPDLSAAAKRANADWALRMNAEHGDEVGLHIHPYTHFVRAAGLRPRHAPVFAAPRAGRDLGYTVNLGAAFGYRATRTLLHAAKEIFAGAGLPTPESFRAGGWTAADHTLRALADEGFRVDASAVPAALLEAWKHNGEPLHPWLTKQWAGIDTASQPYFPARSPGSGARLPLLEVPDNGALADYVTADQMIDLFHRTVEAGLDAGPRVLSIGYHGVSLEHYYPRIDAALTHLDQFLAAEGAGPVVYSTAQEIADLFGAGTKRAN